jgi:hypothetical protein
MLPGIAVTIVAWTAVSYFVKPRSSGEPGNLGDHWSEAIAQLGIFPIFPPTEDIYVGDVYAVIVAEDPHDPTRTKLELRLGKAIKVDHIAKVQEKLKDEYDRAFVFSHWASVAAGSHQGSADSELDVQPRCAEDSCFDPITGGHWLPLALFPGFATEHAVSGSADLPSWQKYIPGLNAKSNASEKIEVQISDPETYGVPTNTATDLMKEYCEPGSATPGPGGSQLDAQTAANQQTNPVCSTRFVRSQFSIRQNDIATELPISNGQTAFRDQVRLIMISRIFLTRNIQYSYLLDDATATEIRNAQNADPKLSIKISDTNRVSVRQILPRPVAIGFNAVEWPLNDNKSVSVVLKGSKINEPE